MLELASLELLGLLRLDTSDEFAQELLSVVNFRVIYNLLHQILLVLWATKV